MQKMKRQKNGRQKKYVRVQKPRNILDVQAKKPNETYSIEMVQ